MKIRENGLLKNFKKFRRTQTLPRLKLAQLNITGGTIRNIALNAAFITADKGDSVRMSHILEAAGSEYAKD